MRLIWYLRLRLRTMMSLNGVGLEEELSKQCRFLQNESIAIVTSQRHFDFQRTDNKRKCDVPHCVVG